MRSLAGCQTGRRLPLRSRVSLSGCSSSVIFAAVALKMMDAFECRDPAARIRPLDNERAHGNKYR